MVLKLDKDGVTVGGKTPSGTDNKLFFDAFNEYVKNWDSIVLKGKHWKDNFISVKVGFDAQGGVTLSEYTPDEYATYVKTGDAGANQGK